MSIGKTAEELGDEIRAAEEFRDMHLASLPDLRMQAVGPGFRKGSKPKEYQPRGSVYEYLTINVPRMLHDNPRVRVTSRDVSMMQPAPDGGPSHVIARQHTLNRWIRDLKFSERLIPFAVDGFFAFGSGITYQEPLRNPPSNKELRLAEGRTPMRPMWKRLLPERRFWDAVADARDEIRFSGHMYYMSPSAIKKRVEQGEDWDMDLVQRGHDAQRDRTRLEDGNRFSVVPPRGEVEIRDVWVSEHEDSDKGENKDQPDEGFHGTIYTLVNIGTQGGAKWEMARPPRAFYGPESGPYTDWGGHPIGDDTFWLAPLVGLNGQMEHLNKMARAVERANEQYKKGLAVADSDPKLAQRFKRFRENGLFQMDLDEINTKVKDIEIGGASPQQYEAMDRAQEQYESVSGINDARRGSLAGAGSATEVAVADNAATIRFDFLNKQFQRGTLDVLSKADWYFTEDDRSRYPVGPELAVELGMPEGNTWYMPPKDKVPHEAYELEIEMYSMERVNEGLHQKRVLEYHQVFLSTIEAAATFGPEAADWNALLKMTGEALNLPDLAAELNLDKLLAQQPQQAQQQPAPPPVSGQGTLGQLAGAAAGGGFTG